MEDKTLEEKQLIYERIRKKIFELEKENYSQKSLNSSTVISKIKKIIEEEVK